MNAVTLPSRALPIRIPRFQSAWFLVALDSESCDVQGVVRIDEETARAAELFPFLQEFSVLIEDLDSIVSAVSHKKPSTRIHRQRMRDIEFPWSASALTELHQELSRA